MYLLYVDESGDPGPAGSQFLILGAAAIFEGKWLPLERDLRTLIDRYFPVPPKPTLSDALKTNQRIYQCRGHRWDVLYNLIETVFFLESNESPGLQFADLASHALWRLITANDHSIATIIQPLFDREPLGSRVNPGKWHGIKYLGNDAAMRARIAAVWP